MARTEIPPTNPSLLGRLRLFPTDETAWSEFVLRYAAAIYSWCREWGLQDADARDVTQSVLTRLAVRMKHFRYDPQQSFRRWLWTVTRHAWADFHSERNRGPRGSGSDLVAMQIDNVSARDDLLQRLDEAFDLELLDEAYARVQARVAPRTWEAFRLLAIEQRSGAEVASQLQMSVASVFVAKSNVQKMLREEVHRLKDGRR